MSLSFGASPAKPAGTGFGLPGAQPSLFGTPTSTPAFGSAVTPAFGSTTPAFGGTTPAFGATSTPAFGSAGLGATGGLNFGAGSNTTTTSTAGLSFGAPISSATTGGLNFGTPASTASAGLGGFNFGGTPASTAASTQGLGFGLLGSTTTATPSLFGANPLGTATSTQGTAAVPSVGLGGVVTTSSGVTGANNASGTAGTGKGSEQQPKQQKLPNEISATVDAFKLVVKKQKSLSSDVMRVSIKPMHKVAREAEEMIRSALALSGEVGRGRAHSRRLRGVAAKALAAAERASRDLPGMEYEGVAPPDYVLELIADLESQLLTFRRQMEQADKQMQAPPRLLTQQELTLGMRRMHESFVALASRLQTVHAQVEAQKEQYLNLRKYVLKDPTNIFDKSSGGTGLDSILGADGGRKKCKLVGFADSGLTSAVLADPRAALGSLERIAGPTPFTYLGGALSQFPTTNTTGTSWGQPQPQANLSLSLNTSTATSVGGAADSSFQLQKPPKRGKQ